MKKSIAGLLSLFLLVSLTSCGFIKSSIEDTIKQALASSSASPTDGTSSAGGILNGGAVDFNAILDGSAASEALSGLSSEQKEAIINSGKEEGVDVIFNADGTTTFKYDDGAIATQDKDGKWDIIDADGTSAQFSREWPENEFTKLVPKPDFGTMLGASTSATEFSVAFSGVSKENLKAYTEKIKTAGFDIEPEVTDESFLGIAAYAYSAKNASGYSIEISSAFGVNALRISK